LPDNGEKKKEKEEEPEKKKPQYEVIEDLPGVGPATAEKLRELGFQTVESLAIATIKELVPAGIGEKQAGKIISEARNTIAMTFIRADELIKMRQNVQRLTTGSKAADELVGGGLETQTITEFYGEYGVGKSIMCHQLAVNAHLPQERGGLNGAALYLDTENTFRPEWIVRMAEPLGLDPKEVAENIIYCEAYNSDHQILLLEKADKVIKENNVRLIIVDSLTAHFRSEYLGREMLAERQQKLNSHMHRLVRLARAFNAVAVVTNQVMSKPDAFFAMAVEPVGGHVVAHTCLHPDTLVQLADGSITKISSVHNPLTLPTIDLKGDLQGATGRCTRVWKTELPEILHIRASFDIKASPNHRFFRLQGLNIVEVQAKDLSTGDYLAYPRKIEVEGSLQPLPEVGIKRFYKLTARGSRLVKSGLRINEVTREDLAKATQLSERTLRRVLNQGFPAETKTFKKMAELAGLAKNLLRECKPHYSNKWHPLHIPSHLEPDLAQVLGYVLGDGNVGERSIRLRDQRLSALRTYRRMFAKIFGVKARIHPIPSKRCYELVINSIEIRTLFKRLIDEWKHIVPKSTVECVASFIKGLVDAEGSVIDWIYVSQKDRSVLEIIQLLLLRFGIKSTIGRAKGSYLLRIAEGTSLRNFQKEIGLTAPDKMRKLSKAVSRRSRIGGDPIPIDRQILWDLAESVGARPSRLVKHRDACAITRSSLVEFIERIRSSAGYASARQDIVEKIGKLEMLVNSPIGWERIRSIEREKANTSVYDITVSPHANFVANGLLVHNSHTRIFLRRTASGPVRIARLVSSPYLPEGERIFKVTNEGVKDVTEEDEVKRRK
jgi:DNA repair protein RadA